METVLVVGGVVYHGAEVGQAPVVVHLLDALGQEHLQVVGFLELLGCAVIDGLQHVADVGRGDGFDLHVVAIGRGDIAGGDLGCGDGLEAVEKGHRGRALRVAGGLEQRGAQLLRNALAHLQAEGLHDLSFGALGLVGELLAVDGGEQLVRIKLLDDVTQVGGQRAGDDAALVGRTLFGLVRPELGVIAGTAYGLVAGNAATEGHVLQGLVEKRSDRHRQDFLAILCARIN